MTRVHQMSKAEAAAPVDQAEIDALMRRFFVQSPAEPPDAVPDIAPRRDFDMASGLLGRASKAFGLLIDRCQGLKRDLEDANERARAQAAEQDDTIEQWKRLAAGLRVQVDVSEQAAAALKARCEALEARAVLAEQQSTELEMSSAQAAERAVRAELLSTELHDRVVSAFGRGSRAHPVLEVFATQEAAE